MAGEFAPVARIPAVARDYVAARMALASLYQDTAAAREELQTARRLEPGAPAILERSGDRAVRAGNRAAAESAYRTAIAAASREEQKRIRKKLHAPILPR